MVHKNDMQYDVQVFGLNTTTNSPQGRIQQVFGLNTTTRGESSPLVQWSQFL